MKYLRESTEGKTKNCVHIVYIKQISIQIYQSIGDEGGSFFEPFVLTIVAGIVERKGQHSKALAKVAIEQDKPFCWLVFSSMH